MAYNYQSGAAAFTEGFIGVFGPALKAKMQADSATKQGFIDKWGDEYTKAKQAMAANTAQNAEHMRQGKAIVAALPQGALPAGMTADQAGSYAAMLVQSKNGDIHSATQIFNDEISSGVITGRQDIEKSSASLIQGTHVPPVGAINNESDELFTSTLASSESSNNPTASNTTGDGRSFGGLFQFGKMRLADYNAAQGTNITVEGIQNGTVSADQQKQIQSWSVSDIDTFIDSQDLKNYEGTKVKGVTITRDSMRAVAHLGGKEGLKKFLSSQGEYNPNDNPENPSQGTTLLDYATKFSVGPQPTSNAVESSADAGPKSTRLNSIYSLPSFDGTSEIENLSLFERGARNLKQTFSGDNTESLMQDALVAFKDQLASAGELDKYTAIQSGAIDLTPRGFGMSGVQYNQSALEMEDFPLASTITSVDEFEGLQADWDSGKFKKTEENTASFNRLMSRYNALPAGLPRNVLDLTTKTKIQAAYAVYGDLSPEQIEKLPEGYGNRLRSVFNSTQENGSGTDIYTDLRDRITAARKADGPEAKEALDLYVMQDLVFKLEQFNSAETSLDSVERVTQLLNIKGMVEDADYSVEGSETTRYAKVLAGIDTSVQTIRTAIELTSSKSSGGGLGSPTNRLGKNSNQTEFVLQAVDASGIPTGQLTYIDAFLDTDDAGEPVWKNRTTLEVIPENTMAKVVELPEDHIKGKQDILTKLPNRGLTGYQKSAGQLSEYLSLSSQMAQIVDDSARMFKAKGSPTANILNAGATIKAVAGLDSVIENYNAAKALFSGIQAKAMQDPDGIADLESSTAMFTALEAQIAEGEKNGITSIATAYHLFEAKKVLLTYKMGVLEGQSGTAMSNKDFDRLMSSLGGKTAETFKKAVSEYASEKYNQLKVTHEAVLGDPMIKEWEKSSDGLPFWSGKFMEQTGIRSPEDWYGDLTPSAKKGFDYFIAGPVGPAPTSVAKPNSTVTSPIFEFIGGVYRRVPKN